MDDASIRRSIRRHLALALAASTLFVAAGGGWAATTNLAGAVVAGGHFVVASYVKKVQHPTGGVVGEILVHEGDAVKAGAVVMRLDATQTRANLAIIVRRLDELTARLARLEAERDDRSEIAFPATLLARTGQPEIAGAIEGERRLFQSRRQARESRKSQLAERILQFGHEIEGLKAQETAFSRGLGVLEGEVLDLQGLRERQLVSIQRLNALETQAATFAGERGEKIAFQAQVAGQIAEARLQILQIDQDLKAEVGAELRTVQGEIGEFAERRVNAEDQLKRIDIRAPDAGIVHELAVHTVGGVIAPGDIVMSLVPEGDSLALEARILPQDIDQIVLGQEATLRLTAFNQRTTPELSGTVTRIAADLTQDPRTGLAWYLVRIEVPPSEVARLQNLVLLPGMPAEAFVRTGERTALSYLVKPLADQINRAFRED